MKRTLSIVRQGRCPVIFFHPLEGYTHAIPNPPYKKINSELATGL